ncbi:MAG: permease prefix domain 1-containing protein [Oscillospiraceae bacterium]|jgi:hypothetical protein|nr:permease prefix domain 1-containing protein [Oscillospiraceae bacterium]
MNEQILHYVDAIFQNAPEKRRVSELREELLSNMNDKYADLVAQGREPNDAFGEVTAGIGDIESLISEVSEGGIADESGGRNRAILLYALGAGLVIVGVLMFFMLMGLGLDIPATVLSAVIVCLGVASFIYGSSIKQPVPYQKEDDSFVEEYKQKYSQPSRNTRLRGAATSLLWVILVICYFAISIGTDYWEHTWLIFLVGVVLQQVINAVFSDKKHSLTSGMIYTSAVLLYLILSFGTDRWDITWLIFLAAVAVEQGVKFVRIWREK